MLSLPGAAATELPKRVFDVHLHFSYDQASETTPQEAIEILKGSLRQIMTPREITQRMSDAAGKAFLLGKDIISSKVIGD